MFVFRDGGYRVATQELLLRLEQSCRSLSDLRKSDALLDPLLRAGELECALCDACKEAGPIRSLAEQITDRIASQFAGVGGQGAGELAARLSGMALPEWVSVSTPEGFAYYGLDPRAYAQLALAAVDEQRPVAVIGIRSIGTTLSAVALAALRQRAIPSARITVRPEGHPFDRQLRLSEEQQRFVMEWRARSAKFFVVDEGPGLSGSSFLAVAEALAAQDVSAADIIFLTSRHAAPESLCAKDAALRWPRYQKLVADFSRVPDDAVSWLGGGQWRNAWMTNGSRNHWPPIWPQTERSKYLSRDGLRLYKFEGLGQYGEAPRQRAQLLVESGFAPPVQMDDRAFAAYQVVAGRPAALQDLNEEILSRIADYCALRVREFPAEAARIGKGSMSLASMAHFNALEGLGVDLDLTAELEVKKPVICDGRMMPHEWLLPSNGPLLKSDGVSHGDDHFFPGPCDIAWDLAGAIVEWDLKDEAGDFFCGRYYRMSGDDVRPRLEAYILAYSLFRMGFCAMAGDAVAGSDEEHRLRAAHRRYRQWAEKLFSRRDCNLTATAQISG
jgi:hypothetical protein